MIPMIGPNYGQVRQKVIDASVEAAKHQEGLTQLMRCVEAADKAYASLVQQNFDLAGKIDAQAEHLVSAGSEIKLLNRKISALQGVITRMKRKR